jgi:hydrogenase/urease accessory protein HupE
MKKTLILALLAPSAAFAHAGDHSHGFVENITHALSQPDHLAIALGVLALGYGLYRAVKG